MPNVPRAHEPMIRLRLMVTCRASIWMQPRTSTESMTVLSLVTRIDPDGLSTVPFGTPVLSGPGQPGRVAFGGGDDVAGTFVEERPVGSDDGDAAAVAPGDEGAVASAVGVGSDVSVVSWATGS